MCYSNCPYEKVGNPETAGECQYPKRRFSPDAHCYEPCEPLEEDEEDENFEYGYADWEKDND